MFGEMLFARAGVGVRCSGQVLNKAIAERSTLYFAHRRLRRPTDDESVGWGHNSQWRTAFHRNYVEDDYYYFNVDGEIDIGASDLPTGPPDPQRDLPSPARRELLAHRCFVRSTLSHTDYYPYCDRLTVRRDEPL